MTDAGLMKLGVAAKLTDVLDAAGVAYDVFDQVPPDSSMDVVNEVARLYAERGCDGFVAIGGGSVIDTTKGAAASLACKGVDFATLQGSEILTRRPAAVHRRAHHGRHRQRGDARGRGGRHEKHAKLSFTSYKLVPHAAILDPALTASLPPKLTATTGMDALTHAIEAYTSIQKNPVSDAFAVKAIELIAANLPVACRDGGERGRAHEPGARLAHGRRGVQQRHGGHRACARAFAGRPLPHPARAGHDDASAPLRALQPRPGRCTPAFTASCWPIWRPRAPPSWARTPPPPSATRRCASAVRPERVLPRHVRRAADAVRAGRGARRSCPPWRSRPATTARPCTTRPRSRWKRPRDSGSRVLGQVRPEGRALPCSISPSQVEGRRPTLRPTQERRSTRRPNFHASTAPTWSRRARMRASATGATLRWYRKRRSEVRPT